jgi:hypothetical protein
MPSRTRLYPDVWRKAYAERQEQSERSLEHWRRLQRIESNVTIFVLMKTDDEPPELAFYCPECAGREFGAS